MIVKDKMVVKDKMMGKDKMMAANHTKKSYTEGSVINKIFNGGLGIKAINALAEFIGGILLIVLNHEWLNRLIRIIAIPELREDPKDFLMNYLVNLGQSLSISSQHAVAVYMLLHGITKLAVILLLWKKKLWVYIPSIVVFGLFIAYEIYSYIQNHSILLLIIILIDAAVIVLIGIEYKHLKADNIEDSLSV